LGGTENRYQKTGFFLRIGAEKRLDNGANGQLETSFAKEK
jgi:hypothetical protein